MNRFLLAVLASSVVTPASAALVDFGNRTLDTSTGLEWLDLTASSGRSASYVAGQFGSGGVFEGYRFATGAEVQAFFASAGVSLGTSEANFAPSSVLLGLIGVTQSLVFSFGTYDAAFGYHVDPGLMPGRISYSFVAATNYGATPDLGEAFYAFDGSPDTDANAAFGSWLVRSSQVPEPATGALAALALMAAAGAQQASARRHGRYQLRRH